MYSSTLISDLGTRRREGSASRPCCTLPPAKTRYPFYRRLCGTKGRSGQVRKISTPPGFDPGTVQPVGSHYIDWATHTTVFHPPKICNNFLVFVLMKYTELYKFMHRIQWHFYCKFRSRKEAAWFIYVDPIYTLQVQRNNCNEWNIMWMR
jgi:hypothetical protein